MGGFVGKGKPHKGTLDDLGAIEPQYLRVHGWASGQVAAVFQRDPQSNVLQEPQLLCAAPPRHGRGGKDRGRGHRDRTTWGTYPRHSMGLAYIIYIYIYIDPISTNPGPFLGRHRWQSQTVSWNWELGLVERFGSFNRRTPFKSGRPVHGRPWAHRPALASTAEAG